MISLLLKIIVSFFAVMNPIGNIPIFISLTNGYSQHQKKYTARKAAFVSFCILTAFLLVGNFIFSMFGITIHAFRVAGGILIFGIAYNLLHAKTSTTQTPHSKEKEEATEKEDISITPLALPIMAGPGTIATVMTLATSYNISNLILVLVGFTLVLGISYLLFYYSTPIIEKLGHGGLNVITRLMGLILAVISIQMIAEGIKGLFPHL
ncbi:MarC family protein [Bacillus sp. EB600]|uniref:MarC family protein n=1 Tax=Bacillus sp. EB600 TaxID=2806345 RepID=UPI00210E81C8|nr:NAAT family transporter [Bacillus sp. EB600]MCQ6279300.1 NAAT family transporter [Bacillus sp. EB600]